MAQAPVPGQAMTDAQARDWALAVHLSALVGLIGIPSVLGPLVVWLVKRDAHPAVDAHGKEALNFNLSAVIYILALGVFTVVTFGFGVIFLIAAAIAWLVLVIIAATRASRGELYRYPLTIRFVS